jgi:DNA-binding NtrC family response regulator
MTTFFKDPDQLKPHVLVVDDEAEMCQMLAISLNKNKFDINYACNAADACKLLEQESYDAIVTDVMMPGENGISFLGRVNTTWPDIPVILMTGYAQQQMTVDAIKNGAFDFVHKPFDFGHMCRVVERAVTYSKLQRLEKNRHTGAEEAVLL